MCCNKKTPSPSPPSPPPLFSSVSPVGGYPSLPLCYKVGQGKEREDKKKQKHSRMANSCPSTFAVIEKEVPAPVKVSSVVVAVWRATAAGNEAAAGALAGAAATRPARVSRRLLKMRAVDDCIVIVFSPSSSSSSSLF